MSSINASSVNDRHVNDMLLFVKSTSENKNPGAVFEGTSASALRSMPSAARSSVNTPCVVLLAA